MMLKYVVLYFPVYALIEWTGTTLPCFALTLHVKINVPLQVSSNINCCTSWPFNLYSGKSHWLSLRRRLQWRRYLGSLILDGDKQSQSLLDHGSRWSLIYDPWLMGQLSVACDCWCMLGVICKDACLQVICICIICFLDIKKFTKWRGVPEATDL